MEQTTTAVGNIMLARSSPVPGIIRLWKLCWASLNHLCNHMTQSCPFIKSKNRVLNPNPLFKINFRLTDNHLEVRKLHVEVFLTTRSQIRTERAKNPTQQWLWRGRSSKSCHLSLRGRSNLPPGGERLAGRVIQKSIDTGGMKAQDQTACSTRMTAHWTKKINAVETLLLFMTHLTDHMDTCTGIQQNYSPNYDHIIYWPAPNQVWTLERLFIESLKLGTKKKQST